MKLLFTVLMFIPFLSIAEINAPPVINLIDRLQEGNGWQLKKSFENGFVLYEKKIEGLKRNAVRISGTLHVNPETIVQVVKDVNNYGSFLSSKNITCEIVENTEKYIVGYQHISARFIKDRHLLFQMYGKTTGEEDSLSEVNWEILSPEKQLKDFINDKMIELNKPKYIKYGAGTWTFETLENGETSVSYSLYMDPEGWIPGFLIEKVITYGIKQIFNDVILEAERREDRTR